MTTLGFERGTSAASSYERLKSELDDMIAIAKAQGRNTDPIVRQRLAWAWSKVEILRMSSLRILTAVVHDRHTRETAGLEAMPKLDWTDSAKGAPSMGISLLGPAGQLLTGKPL